MAGLLEGASTFLGSPGGSLAMSGLGALGNTMKGNQAAKASQDPVMMMRNNPGLNPRYAGGMGATLDFMGSHPGAGKGGMGASSIANSMVNSGATLTSQQGKALSPQVKQNLAGQGGITPGLMENFMKQLTPQMIASLFELFGGGGQGEQKPPSEGY